MTSSFRRLERSPSSRRTTVDTLQDQIDAFLTHHEAMGHSPATVKHYHDSLALLLRCFADKDIEPVIGSLTAKNFNVFAAWLRATPTRVWRGKTTRSIHGVHGALKDLKAFQNWMFEEEVVTVVAKVPVPRLPHNLFPILSDDDLDLIFHSAEVTGNSEMAIRNRALIAFMLDTGVRLSETSGLTVANLDVANREAKISGKGNKERMVFFSEGVGTTLRRWLTIRGDDPGPVFWLTASGVKMLFRRIKDETGLVLFTPHQVRHTAFTSMVKQGVDLHSVKRIAGHASVTTTEAYLALAGEDVKEKHALASPFDAVSRRSSPAPTSRRRLRSA